MSIRNYVKKLAALLCAALVLSVTAVPAVSVQAATASTASAATATRYTKVGTTGAANTSVNLRTGASYSSKVIVVLKKGDAVKVIGSKLGWLHVTATHNGKTYKGYMGPRYITLKKSVTFTKLMDSIWDVRAGAAGTSLRAQEAIKTLKAYAKTQTVKASSSSWKSLAAKWIKAEKSRTDLNVKSTLKENIEAIEDEMSDSDSTDVLYLQILNGILDAC